MTNVSAESPTLVLPWGLSKLFEQTRTGNVLTNEFPSGDSIRLALADDSLRICRVSRRCTPPQVDSVVGFYESLGGPLRTFWFYDLGETATRFRHDPTGVETIGRYCVRFVTRLESTYGLGRSDLSFELIEVAG